MNLSQTLKRKRDAEDRLRRNDPQKMLVYGETDGADQQVFISNTYIQQGDNVSITQEGNITYIEASVPIKEYYEPLTNGDPDDPQVLFTPEGDILMGVID